MTAPLESCAQLAEVVDLAVQHDDDGAVLVVDRLVSGGKVDDPQALDAQPDAGRHVQAARVGTAMLLGRAHPLDQPRIDGGSVASELADDAAHQADLALRGATAARRRARVSRRMKARNSSSSTCSRRRTFARR